MSTITLSPVNQTAADVQANLNKLSAMKSTSWISIIVIGIILLLAIWALSVGQPAPAYVVLIYLLIIIVLGAFLLASPTASTASGISIIAAIVGIIALIAFIVYIFKAFSRPKTAPVVPVVPVQPAVPVINA